MSAAIWSILLNTTLQAAVHLGRDYEVNFRFVKNRLWNSVEQLFNETGRLIRDQTEITGVTTIDFEELTWRSTSLLCSKAFQITNAKMYIFSDWCFVWEKWEMIRLQLGRTKLDGIRRILTTRNCIASTVCRRRPAVWKHMSDAAKSKAKQKGFIEKPKFDNARRLRGIFH